MFFCLFESLHKQNVWVGLCASGMELGSYLFSVGEWSGMKLVDVSFNGQL